MDTKTMLWPYRFRLIGAGLGLIMAVLFLTIGFGPTLLIVTLTFIGFVIGKWRDGALRMEEWVAFFTRN